MKKKSKVFTSLKLMYEVRNRLEKEALEKGISLSEYIEKIIEEQFDNQKVSNQITSLEEENEAIVEILQQLEAEQRDYESDLEYIEYVEAENFRLLKKLNDLEGEMSVGATFRFSENEQRLLAAHLEKIQKRSDVSERAFLPKSLTTKRWTEDDFWISPIIQFFNKNRLQ